MKRFTKKVLIYFISVLIICFVPCLIVDPFNVFHPLNIRSNGVEPNKNYIKTYYILHNPDSFDDFILGSSHVAILNPEKISKSCYNMYYSGASIDENLATIETLVKNGIIPRHLYIGVDNISYVDNFDVHKTQRLRSPYQYSESNPLDFFMLYLDPVVNLKAVSEILKSGNDVFLQCNEEFYSNGGAMAYEERNDLSQDVINADLVDSYAEMTECVLAGDIKNDWGYLTTALDSMKSIKELCDEYGIELTVFINPMFYSQFKEAVVNRGFLYFMSELANITPYYNFSGFNKYTTDAKYYYSDAEHYSSYLGDIMIECFANGNVDHEAYDQGFGVYVTSDNVNELIAVLTDNSLM